MKPEDVWDVKKQSTESTNAAPPSAYPPPTRAPYDVLRHGTSAKLQEPQEQDRCYSTHARTHAHTHPRSGAVRSRHKAQGRPQ